MALARADYLPLPAAALPLLNVHDGRRRVRPRRPSPPRQSVGQEDQDERGSEGQGFCADEEVLGREESRKETGSNAEGGSLILDIADQLPVSSIAIGYSILIPILKPFGAFSA